MTTPPSAHLRWRGRVHAGVRSPLGEWRNAAPAERYSAKAVDAARGTQHTDGELNAPGLSAIPARRRSFRSGSVQAVRFSRPCPAPAIPEVGPLPCAVQDCLALTGL